MRVRNRNNSGKVPRYEEIASRIANLVSEGVFRPGEKVPSVRKLSRQMSVSTNTVIEAYGMLEDRRLIEARPQSGYYVCPRLPAIPDPPDVMQTPPNPMSIGSSEISLMIMRDTLRSDVVQLGAAVPNVQHLPVDKLNRILTTETRRFGHQSFSYMISPGLEKLRFQIAKRAVDCGATLSAGELVITSGCVEAVKLSLQAVCRPGDTIAVESPVYFNFLLMARELGLRVLEIPSTPREGISIEALRYALEYNPVKACLVITNFTNPLGSLMPNERKKELVDLLAHHEIPLIEDDIYGDLSFANERPMVAKAYDKKGLVILCSSVSKTLVPGYRIGWVAPGKFQQEIEQLKLMTNVATASPTQLAIAEFLAGGGYDRHLRAIRRIYAKQVALMGEAIGKHFPEGTRVTRPAGGFVVWVEMPERVNALKLYELAIRRRITIAPGPIFSASGKYRNNIRLNAAHWSEKIEQAVQTLGKLAEGLI
ncbi:MAG TPA: PLP-dependent aminotransferase family protein [Geobacteraceae bacterium]